MFNPHAHILRSKGLDLPILKVYMAGRIAGDCIDLCLAWRKQLVEHYRQYEIDPETGDYARYPIAFLDALNSKEADSIDAKGLTSAIQPNLIYDKDILSIKTADAIVANMDDFIETNILNDLYFNSALDDERIIRISHFKLKQTILNRRENFGTIEEVAIARFLGKPVILIVPERRLETFQKHPFQKRASVIVTSVDQLIKEKHLEILYKSIAGVC